MTELNAQDLVHQDTTEQSQFPTFSIDRMRRELAARGHHPDGQGVYLCPFHAENTPSFQSWNLNAGSMSANPAGSE